MGGILRLLIGVGKFIILGCIVTFIFVSCNEDAYSPAADEKTNQIFHGHTGMEQYKNMSYETKIYVTRMETFLENVDDNVIHLQTFFLEKKMYEEAHLAIDAKQILDLFGKHYFAISDKVLQEYIEKENENWEVLCKNQEDWESPEWQKLKNKHLENLKEAIHLQKVYKTIPKDDFK